ncbi:MAG: hypothetical protein Q7S52_01120 [bacterium]|nr:hypothetical protein [bacterium]
MWIFESISGLFGAFLFRLNQRNIFEYKALKPSERPRTREDLQCAYDKLEHETRLFRERIGRKQFNELTFDEYAWYESIRRREAALN